jgi:hypothetical protein
MAEPASPPDESRRVDERTARAASAAANDGRCRRARVSRIDASRRSLSSNLPVTPIEKHRNLNKVK